MAGDSFERADKIWQKICLRDELSKIVKNPSQIDTSLVVAICLLLALAIAVCSGKF